MREQHRSGIQYLRTATALLNRVRAAHPTAGLLEAADLQWWWRSPRRTDDLPQLFWFDDLDRPAAGVIATDWGDGVALDPIVMPGATRDWITRVIDRGIAHAECSALGTLQVVVDSADTSLREALARHGFTVESDQSRFTVQEAWLASDARPPISPLHDGYRLVTRIDAPSRPHHMIQRSGPDVESRLRQTSLYRPDLDLAILDSAGDVAAYALFWLDPATATGLVEPMRTEAAHQRRGLARHLLTTGLDRLARAGAQRVKICFRPDHAPAKDLYLGAGFEPLKQAITLTRGPSGKVT